MSTPLFRAEVSQAHGAQWLGVIHIGRNPRFALVAAVALALGTALILFALWGQATRKARVAGLLTPVTGSLPLAAQAAGTVQSIAVAEGAWVEAGQTLLTLHTDRAGASGDTAALVAQTLAQRQISLDTERQLRDLQTRQRQQALADRMRALRTEADQAQREAEGAQRRVDLAQRNVDRYQQLAQAGFVAEAQAQQRQDEWLDLKARADAARRSVAAIEREWQSLQAEQRATATQGETERAQWFEQRHLGDITSRFGAVGAIQRTVTTALIEAVLDGIMALAALVMMLLYAPTLAGVVVAAVVLYGLLRWASFRPLRDAAAERLVVAARENTHFIESLRAIQPLKLFGREEQRRSRWQNLIVEVQNRDVHTARMNIGFSTANTLIFGVENLLVLWLGARLVMGGPADGAPAFSIGMLFAFMAYKGQFTGRVSALINYAVEIKMLGLHAERLADIALTPPERDVAGRGSLPDSDLAHLQPSLELRNVSYRYGEGEPWVLRHANLVVQAGESVAVVGPSGAGKTTLLKILLGILPPSEGEVLYGGVPVRQLGLANVRARIGTVMQEDVLLSGSLADNIAFFDPQADAARIEACARLAQVHAEIVRMPMGYHTLVGDLGSGLSGGQRQRTLLARALYKQPAVLALDEATSHLDIGNERAIAQALSQLQHTRLVIAHRPETVAGAHRVVRVADGAVVALMRDLAAAGHAAP